MVVQDRDKVVDSLKHLPWGSHICVFYNTPDDFADIFVPYFKAGLENNEFCFYITPDSPGKKSSKAAVNRVTSGFTGYLETGQLKVISQEDFYFENGVFNSDRPFNDISVKYTQALEKGYKGMRIGSCVPQLENEEWLNFNKAEGEVNDKIGKTNTLALCAYTLDKCKPVKLVDIINTHKYVLNTKDGNYVFLGNREDERARQMDNQTEERYQLVIRNLKKKLRESQDRYSKTLHASSEMVTITTLKEGKILEADDNFTRITGYTRDELIGHNTLEMKIWPKLEKRKSMVDRLIKHGNLRNQEEVLRTKSGEKRTVLYSGELITIGGQSCILMVTTDITGAKKQEEEEHAIISTAIDGFWTTDLHGNFLEVNDSYCRMIGYTREELLKMSITDVEALEHPEDTAKHIKKVILHGSDRFKTQHRCKDGKIIDLEINTNYYNIGKGQLFVFIHDLTGKKEAENSRETRIQTRWRKDITRLQEKFIKEGFQNFEDREIIELLLSMVMPARKAKQLAIMCIGRFKTLSNFLKASPGELTQIGVTPACVFCIDMLHRLPIKVLQDKISKQSIYDSPQDIFDYFYYSMRDLEKESFKIMFLNARNQVMEVVDLFEGTADKIAINAREVVENAIAHNTSSLVFIHNHPSGDPTPSQPDKQLTRDLVFVGNILQIRVLDHIIIGENRYFSFAGEGLIKEYETDFLNLKLTGTSEAKRRLSRAKPSIGL